MSFVPPLLHSSSVGTGRARVLGAPSFRLWKEIVEPDKMLPMAEDKHHVVVVAEGREIAGTFLRGSLKGALFRIDDSLSDTTELGIVLNGASTWGRRTLFGVGRRVEVPGADSGDVGLRWLRLVSRDGIAPLKEFISHELETDFSQISDEHIVHTGSYWTVVCEPENTRAWPPERLMWNAEEFAEAFDRGGTHSTLYPKNTVAYSVGMISHQGRAIRMTNSSVTVHTNSVLPPLGSLVYLQFLLPEEDGFSVSIVRGMVSSRSDKSVKKGGKSHFDIRIRDAFDMDIPGRFGRYLDTLKELLP